MPRSEQKNKLEWIDVGDRLPGSPDDEALVTNGRGSYAVAYYLSGTNYVNGWYPSDKMVDATSECACCGCGLELDSPVTHWAEVPPISRGTDEPE